MNMRLLGHDHTLGTLLPPKLVISSVSPSANWAGIRDSQLPITLNKGSQPGESTVSAIGSPENMRLTDPNNGHLAL